jgi:hypothetical protein
MNMGRFNYERAATALVEAAYLGDVEAAEKHGVTTRSIRRWRDRLDDDRKLSALVRVKRKKAEEDWAKELSTSIRAAINFLARASQNANVKDPETIEAVTAALEVLTSVAMTKRVLDERFGHTEKIRDAVDWAGASSYS